MHPHKYSHSPAQWTTLALSPTTNSLLPLPAADISKSVVWLFPGCFRFLIFIMSPQHLAFAPSVSIFPHLPPKDTAVSGIRPGCGLVLAGQWAMQAFFSPHSGLLSGVFTLRCVLLGPLYPHYWLQVMFWTQSSWPRRRPDTSLSQEEPQETGHTLILSVGISRFLWLAASH